MSLHGLAPNSTSLFARHVKRWFWSAQWRRGGLRLPHHCKTPASTLSANMRKSRPWTCVCVCVCVCADLQHTHTHTHTYAWSHPRAYTHTDSFRFKGALGEKVICSQTTKLNNDPDTLPSWRVSSACNTRRRTYSKSSDSTEVSFELA